MNAKKFLLPFVFLLLPVSATAQTENLKVVVNSNQDGAVNPDDALTLREAIEIVNGTLSLDRLSSAEKSLVSSNGGTGSLIAFNLPSADTTIRLVDVLPPLASPGLIVDGTTQPEYDSEGSATAEIAIPIPVVAIAPAANREVFRGLTVVADGVTIRGLSLYGFTSRHRATATLPPADIFIDNPQSAAIKGAANGQKLMENREGEPSPISNSPKNVVIENNWLGILPDQSVPQQTSAFGVFVFNSLGTTIQRNRIANHDGSGIITSVQAENLQVTENIIVGNGIAGMPDAIRLEGRIDNTQVSANLICGNDGSGVFLFKPQGAAQINNNQIIYNGRRLRRAAVYLMGNDHQVRENQIGHQTGPGVVVASYPKSDRNLIQSNRYFDLDGLSIDLIAQQNTGVQEYQRGDGPNPPRNSPNRRLDTANSAINAPQFISREFFVLGNKTNLSGTADPGSQVTVYQVKENTETPYAPLSEPLTTIAADDEGKFSVTVDNLQPGDRVSAIATDPKYGTSEPAANALISSTVAGKQQTVATNNPAPTIPQCTTAPAPPVVQVPPEEPPPSPPEPIRIQVPTNVHFALDKATISPESARILNRIAEVLQANPPIVIELRGHTDPRASDAYNLDLSNRRAIAVRNYLLRQGIAPERMTIRALGESQLRVTGRNRLDHARNRRVEFIFKDARGIDLFVQEEDLQLE
ncbi:OmpA family protein [Coleofasciculus sp. FACHB-64]|uniref:OmpA family protein n=1 Tax=Cyanophyceae TaxID=3028117 RepID=UPI001681FEAF|nr:MULTISPECIES: OmpA family protein [unclassified Coleofasciculus]MBD1841502.1 OmpA family protein [Coleofasciculus sp. FACHB-501]MBD2048928.1 OmpA family protein [Coleofasciculus sp. FACHB-64]